MYMLTQHMELMYDEGNGCSRNKDAVASVLIGIEDGCRNLERF